MKEGLKPGLIALVLCDNIYHDASGKAALIGLFNGISAARFPTVHPRMAVFVSLTSLRSGMHGKLEIVRSDNDEPIMAAQGQFPADSTPTDVLDMQFILNNIRFEEPGTYFVRFSGNGSPLAHRPFQVERVVPKHQGGKE